MIEFQLNPQLGDFAAPVDPPVGGYDKLPVTLADNTTVKQYQQALLAKTWADWNTGVGGTPEADWVAATPGVDYVGSVIRFSSGFSGVIQGVDLITTDFYISDHVGTVLFYKNRISVNMQTRDASTGHYVFIGNIFDGQGIGADGAVLDGGPGSSPGGNGFWRDRVSGTSTEFYGNLIARHYGDGLKPNNNSTVAHNVFDCEITASVVPVVVQAGVTYNRGDVLVATGDDPLATNFMYAVKQTCVDPVLNKVSNADVSYINPHADKVSLVGGIKLAAENSALIEANLFINRASDMIAPLNGGRAKASHTSCWNTGVRPTAKFVNNLHLLDGVTAGAVGAGPAIDDMLLIGEFFTKNSVNAYSKGNHKNCRLQGCVDYDTDAPVSAAAFATGSTATNNTDVTGFARPVDMTQYNANRFYMPGF